ncbi:MAG TPA: carboxylesterase family protein [Caulobacteraceae bacterium]|nr:carboxylesterase family protein [Caulobacteraceae bacterium]
MNAGRSAVLAIALLSLAAGAALPAPGPIVRLETGQALGKRVGPALEFLGIPYAAPPLGPLRWEPPQPARPWAGVRDATQPAPACLQQINADGSPNEGFYSGPVSEDCLTLDVTAPPHARKAPVMVWIFGGGDVAGATTLPSYDARNFARDGVVFVAMNYRLGALGFFAHPALTAEAPKAQPLANYGLMDQVAALDWVRRNIARFGGDPANVTIFGESAGGEDVLDLMAIPAARGLFQKAIVESGLGWEPAPSLHDWEAKGSALASRLGLPGASATAAQLRALPASALAAAYAQVGGVVDGRLVIESSRDAFARSHEAAVPLIIGTNSNEASILAAFGMKTSAFQAGAAPGVRAVYQGEGDAAEQGRRMFNDQLFAAPARWIAGQHARKAPAWLYYFSYLPTWQRGVRPGVNHATEIPFVFDSVDAVTFWDAHAKDPDRAEAAYVHSCWVAFARLGRPDCAGPPPWPAYDANSDQLLDFDDPAQVRHHFRKAQLDAQQAAAGLSH